MSSTVVKYNTKEIIPVDNVSIVYNMGRIANDDCLKTTYSIDIHGYLIYNAGSPNTSGTFGHFSSSECELIPQDEMLHALLAKQCALGNLFSEHYKELELGTNVGNPNLYAYPRVVSINIDDTSRPNYWPYTVSLEADNIYCDGSPIGPTGCPCINSYTESWDISYDENEFISESGNNRLWKITHNLNAVGAGIAGPSGFTTTPYECAKDFICSRKGINSVVPQTCIDEFSCTGQMYNYYDSHSIDETAGSYSLTESWYCTELPYIEQYTVETSESSDQACPTVSINGSIRGFEIRTNGSVTTSRYQSSKARYDELEASTGILTWAEDLSGYDLDSNPTSKTYSLNKYTGDISFSATYRKLPFKWLPSAKFENVSISNNFNENIFAEVTLLDAGQVIHPIAPNNFKIYRRSLSIDAVYPCGTGIGRFGPRFTSPYADEIQDVVDYYNPISDPSVAVVAVESQTETWNPQLGSYQYNVSFAFNPTGIC